MKKEDLCYSCKKELEICPMCKHDGMRLARMICRNEECDLYQSYCGCIRQ